LLGVGAQLARLQGILVQCFRKAASACGAEPVWTWPRSPPKLTSRG
jgi:hypothetical protein